MSTPLTGVADRADKPPVSQGRAMLAAFLALLAVAGAAELAFGRQIRAAHESAQARITNDENSAFCSRFGAGPETGRYAECASGLDAIRTRYRQRSADLLY